jgi:hypothetical protein
MKLTLKNRLLLGLFCACLLVGCAGKPIKVGTIEPQFDYNSIDWSKGTTLQASAGGLQLLLFIPIQINDRQERAYRKLHEYAGNYYITNIKIKESWTYAFIGTVYTTTLEAKAYPRKTMAGTTGDVNK